MDRIVLAYSGGLETSAAISWLAEKYRAEVVTLTWTSGRARAGRRARARARDWRRARPRARRARRIRTRLRAAGAPGRRHRPGRDPLGTALTPAAHRQKSSSRSPTSRAPRPSPMAITASDPRLGRDRSLSRARSIRRSRSSRWPRPGDVSQAQLIPYAKERGIPMPADAERSYRTDANLWGRSIQCGQLVDAWQDVPEDVYALTKSPADAPERPAFVEIEFERGVPVRLNGVADVARRAHPVLETIAGAHGIGRADRVDGSVEGAASREIYEAPAAVVLAHGASGSPAVRDAARPPASLRRLGVKYADLVRQGHWYTPTREAIDALVANVQQRVTGTVRLKLYKGDCRVAGREASAGSAKFEVRSSKHESLRSGRLDEHALVRAIHVGARQGRLRLRQVAVRRSPARRGRHRRQPGLGRGARQGRRAIDAADVRAIVRGLDEVREAVRATPALILNASDEDVHSFVERELVARIGDAGKRLHTGRSRNEQVSLDCAAVPDAAHSARAGGDRRRSSRALADQADRGRPGRHAVVHALAPRAARAGRALCGSRTPPRSGATSIGSTWRAAKPT